MYEPPLGEPGHCQCTAFGWTLTGTADQIGRTGQTYTSIRGMVYHVGRTVLGPSYARRLREGERCSKCA